jgi:hypothetical protein
MHNIAHLFCKGHLDDILTLLLFHHLKLETLKEDNTDLILGLVICYFTIIDVKIIVDKCMFKLNKLFAILPPPPHFRFNYCPLHNLCLLCRLCGCCHCHHCQYSICLCCCHCHLHLCHCYHVYCFCRHNSSCRCSLLFCPRTDCHLLPSLYVAPTCLRSLGSTHWDPLDATS